MELRLTKEQEKAVKSLERAFKKCKDANLYIHNCYGCLEAFDRAVVDSVDDEKDDDDLDCEKHAHFIETHDMGLVSWADDRHYVHLKKGRK